jgi:hypothetical protein
MYTSATEARAGKDIQGIPWERLNLIRKTTEKLGWNSIKTMKTSFPRRMQ